MKDISGRVLTTHVGSLPRPKDLLDLMKAKLEGAKYDHEAYASRVRSAVADTVRTQVECGIDIPSDGEQGKPGFFSYVSERLAGFEPDSNASPAGSFKAEADTFPEYYEQYFREAMFGGAIARVVPLVCTGPVVYRGEEALRRDIDNLKAAVAASKGEQAFMPAIPSCQHL